MSITMHSLNAICDELEQRQLSERMAVASACRTIERVARKGDELMRDLQAECDQMYRRLGADLANLQLPAGPPPADAPAMAYDTRPLGNV